VVFVLEWFLLDSSVLCGDPEPWLRLTTTHRGCRSQTGGWRDEFIVRLGILSDSHGRFLIVRKALLLLEELGAAHFIHCGDVGGIEVFEELVGRPCTFVWGNTDVPAGGLLAFLHSAGVSVPTSVPTLLDFDGQRIAVYHGHEPGFGRAAHTLKVDYILHGHTHEPRDESVGSVRIINPGALHRARIKTVAILDTDSAKLSFHEIQA